MKRIKWTVLALALSLTAAGCGNAADKPKDGAAGNSDANKSGKPTELVISTWGINEDLMKKNLYEPFEKANNVKIVTEIGNNGDRLNKLRQGNSKVDLMYLSDYYTIQGIQEGLFEKINRANIPNINNLYDIAKAPMGQDYGPAHTVTSFGIVYNEKNIKEPLTSWSDLWKADFKGKLSLPEVTLTSGPMIIDIASKAAGETAFNEDKAFAKLKDINKSVVKYYSKSSDVINMFGQGEVSVAAVQDFAYGSILKAVPTAKWVTPKEGAYAVVNTVNIAKGSKNKELAEKFINWHLSQEVQQANAVGKVDSPSNKLVKLTPEQAVGMTYGEDTVKNLKLLNWDSVNKNMKKWTDRWNREMQ